MNVLNIGEPAIDQLRLAVKLPIHPILTWAMEQQKQE